MFACICASERIIIHFISDDSFATRPELGADTARDRRVLSSCLALFSPTQTRPDAEDNRLSRHILVKEGLL